MTTCPGGGGGEAGPRTTSPGGQLVLGPHVWGDSWSSDSPFRVAVQKTKSKLSLGNQRSSVKSIIVVNLFYFIHHGESASGSVTGR